MLKIRHSTRFVLLRAAPYDTRIVDNASQLARAESPLSPGVVFRPPPPRPRVLKISEKTLGARSSFSAFVHFLISIKNGRGAATFASDCDTESDHPNFVRPPFFVFLFAVFQPLI
ncbi:hypothetical protein GWI33_011806 [Rhynchophorus ferrugineus]|uniref:Uncharacterized protein n=1 Tax=Rhynchophorus ferrugineus TaxID=354439 RepID=A0A834IJS0_RHYFE|nr:hypothetical protein GWI33_011806 [Rhynchophorus ferrugineus]